MTMYEDYTLTIYLLPVYTRWRNLKKTNSMEVGAIGYHDSSKVKNLWVVKDKETVKRLDKTKEVRFTPFTFILRIFLFCCVFPRFYFPT
jgi:hypothetical protein